MNATPETDTSRPYGCGASGGQLTVEAALTLPVFLAMVMLLSALVRYPLACLRIEMAMSDAARLLAVSAYPAQLGGVLDWKATLEETGVDGVLPGRSLFDGLSGFLEGLGLSTDKAEFSREALDAYERISRDITAEGSRTLNEWANEGMGLVAEELVTWRLRAMLGSEGEPWSWLGVTQGQAGVDFSDSWLDVSKGQLCLVAAYQLKPSAPFDLAPSIACRSRIRMSLWDMGHGQALRSGNPLADAGTDASGNTPGDSLWNHANITDLSWNRGLIIEERELARIHARIQQGGGVLWMDSPETPGCDALSASTSDDGLTAWQVISLNPFLPSYLDNPTAVRKLLRGHLSRMPVIGTPVEMDGRDDVGIGMRRLVLVVPENAPAWMDAMAFGLMGEFAGKNAMLELVRGYGNYNTTGTLNGEADGNLSETGISGGEHEE